MIPQCDPGAFSREHRREVQAALQRVVDSGWYVLGEEVQGFEREFCKCLGVTHAIGVASGTDAVSIALRALGVGPGARVATVSHTAVATVTAIQMVGAVPVFVDIDRLTFNMDPQALDQVLHRTEGIAAIVAVHLYGHPADMPALLEIARTHGIPLIEDCAQAHGARIGGRFVGTFGAAAAYSFYPTKNLGAIGDGGLIATADPEIAARVRMLREYGWRQRYVSEVSGVNSRLDEIQAAFLRARLPYLEAGNRRRAAIAAAYDRGLAHTGLPLPVQLPGCTHVFHQYVVRHPDRESLRLRLKEQGIATNVHYPLPVHAQPAYRSAAAADVECTEKAAREVLSLPMFPELEDTSVAQVIEAVLRSL
jgi:dTDP-4-amino-4,6-dideoxygalactose transaminase